MLCDCVEARFPGIFVPQVYNQFHSSQCAYSLSAKWKQCIYATRIWLTFNLNDCAESNRDFSAWLVFTPFTQILAMRITPNNSTSNGWIYIVTKHCLIWSHMIRRVTMDHHTRDCFFAKLLVCVYICALSSALICVWPGYSFDVDDTLHWNTLNKMNSRKCARARYLPNGVKRGLWHSG